MEKVDRLQQPNPKNKYNGPITIACVLRSSPDYSPASVKLLKKQVDVNLNRDHRFICLTDETKEDFPSDIEVIKLCHPEWITKQSKIELFRGDLDLGRVLYLDLDTVICGCLDDIASYSGIFCMLGDLAGKPQECRGSGVMAWGDDFGLNIYEEFLSLDDKTRKEVYYPNGGRGDQLFINQKTSVEPHAFQELFPGQIYSYKLHCKNGKPANARLVCFHGRPKMRDVIGESPWILKT